MAVTAGKAGYGTVTGTASNLYTSGDGSCSKFWVQCRTCSTHATLVNISALHGTAYVALDAGTGLEFQNHDQGIEAASAKSIVTTGAAHVSWCVTGQTSYNRESV